MTVKFSRMKIVYGAEIIVKPSIKTITAEARVPVVAVPETCQRSAVNRPRSVLGRNNESREEEKKQERGKRARDML